MVTIKYSPSGRQEWRETYDGPLGGDDRATAAVLDHSGNLVVVGAVSTALSTFGDSFYDYLIVKYNADGDTLWVRTYDGGGSYPSDDATAVVVDAADNIYVTGDSYGISEDCLTLKYGPAGDLIWAGRYNGPGNGEDHAKALAVDNLGNVYITGNSDSGMENDDIVTVKYSTEGIQQWVNRYDGPPGEDEDGGEAIAIGPDGLACVVGWSPSLSTSDDIMVLKYTAIGDTAWTRRIDGAVHTRDVGNALDIDNSGDLYVGGSVGIGSSSCTYEAKNATVVKFAPDGQLLWSWSMDNTEPCSDAIRELTVDSSGSVFAVGSSGYPGSYTWEDYHRMLSVKISAAGELVWFDEHEGSAAGQAGGVALALDPSGNLLVTGTTIGIGSDQDIATIKIRRSNFCGDANGSGAVSISDAVYLIKYIFGGGPAPSPILAGDVNCSGAVSISDAVYLINYIFAGGPAPCASCP